MGDWLHKVLGQIGSELWFPWQQIAVVMDGTLAPAIFKPEKNLVFFQDKIAGARDAAPGKLE